MGRRSHPEFARERIPRLSHWRCNGDGNRKLGCSIQPRVFEGVPHAVGVDPDWLILDGQQRLTALYQAMYSKQPVSTVDPRKKPIKRWYYLDIAKALDPRVDREDAILALPEDRIVRNFRGEPIDDFSTPDAEYRNAIFPFSDILHSSKWRREFSKYSDHDREHVELRPVR